MALKFNGIRKSGGVKVMRSVLEQTPAGEFIDFTQGFTPTEIEPFIGIPSINPLEVDGFQVNLPSNAVEEPYGIAKELSATLSSFELEFTAKVSVIIQMNVALYTIQNGDYKQTGSIIVGSANLVGWLGKNTESSNEYEDLFAMHTESDVTEESDYKFVLDGNNYEMFVNDSSVASGTIPSEMQGISFDKVLITISPNDTITSSDIENTFVKNVKVT